MLKKIFLLLFILIICLSICVVFINYKKVNSQGAEVSNITETGLSNFELGQYYFNHDEDPAGPYDLVEARKYFELAIDEDPSQHELLWYQLGRIDFIEGKFDGALSKFSKQQELFNDDVPNVYYMIGLTHGYKARREGVEESWVLAEENFLKFIEFSPHSPWPRVDLAWIYFSQGKFEEMKPVLEVGLDYQLDNPWLLNMYGLAVMNTAVDKTDAIPYFRAAEAMASKLTPDDWGSIYPGNDPELWPGGISEFRSLIAKNLELITNTQ